jgi:hypothetical protein
MSANAQLQKAFGWVKPQPNAQQRVMLGRDPAGANLLPPTT